MIAMSKLPYFAFFTELGREGNAVARHPLETNGRGQQKVILAKTSEPKVGEVWFGWLDEAPCGTYYFFHPIFRVA